MPHNDLDAARHDAIHALCVAQAEDRLSVEQFEQRLLLLREAPTSAAVRQIVGDLETTGDYGLVARDAPLPAGVAPLEQLRISAVFSGAKRSGRWTVPLFIETQIMFGSVKLDLRDAWFESDTLEIDVDAWCGSLQLIVPPGTQVEIEVSETMSGSEHKRGRNAASAEWNGLLVRITGSMFMSGLKIIERPPSSEQGGFLGGVREVVKRLRA